MTQEPKNPSRVWASIDISLLSTLRSEMPDASVIDLARQFNARGPQQIRTPQAVRKKLYSLPPRRGEHYVPSLKAHSADS
jgi:hypothetical protein